MGLMIYGAGAYGGLAEKLIISSGGTVDAFADKRLAGGSKDNIAVISPDDIPDGYEGTVYIAVKNHYSEIKDYLKEKKCKDIRSISSLFDRDVSDIPENLSEREKDAWFQRRTFEINEKLSEKEGIKFKHIEAVVTERCTLRCRDCSSLMPYYTEPKDADLSLLMKAINNLLSVVSYIGEVRILGGEPFLNQNIGAFIHDLAALENIGIISVYTNGMVLPEETTWDMLKNHQIPVHVSDYGIGEKTRNRFIEKANEMGLEISVRKYDSWYDMGKLIPNGYTDAEINEMFASCIPGSCPTLLNGKLYQCPRAAHADNLGKLKSNDREYVNLLGAIDEPDKNILECIAERKRAISICRFCLGTNDSIVDSAIQMKGV